MFGRILEGLASWASDSGCRSRWSGHAEIATTECYADLADDPIRQANERIGDHIWAVMSGQPKADVVAIGERGEVKSS